MKQKYETESVLEILIKMEYNKEVICTEKPYRKRVAAKFCEDRWPVIAHVVILTSLMKKTLTSLCLEQTE